MAFKQRPWHAAAVSDATRRKTTVGGLRQARAKAAAASAARRGDLDAVIAQLEARQAAWRGAEAPPAPPDRPLPAPRPWCAAL